MVTCFRVREEYQAPEAPHQLRRLSTVQPKPVLPDKRMSIANMKRISTVKMEFPKMRRDRILETDSESGSSESSGQKTKRNATVKTTPPPKVSTTVDWTQTDISMFNLFEKLMPEFDAYREKQSMLFGQ